MQRLPARRAAWLALHGRIAHRRACGPPQPARIALGRASRSPAPEATCGR